MTDHDACESETDDVRQGQPRGVNRILAMSMLGAGALLLVVLLIFAF